MLLFLFQESYAEIDLLYTQKIEEDLTYKNEWLVKNFKCVTELKTQTCDFKLIL